MSSFDLKAVEDHFSKISSKKKMIKAAVTIQSVFRGWKARKFYKRFKMNKIRLALYVQKAWRKYSSSVKESRQNNENKLKKIILIQSYFRGILTRKNWKRKMIQKLTTNNHFFNQLKDKIITDSVIYIQRFWRTLIPRLRKFKKASEANTNRRLTQILTSWSKITKTAKKNKNKRVQPKPQNNIEVASNDHKMKNPVVDMNASKALKPGKRRATNIRPNLVTNNLSNMNSSINKGMHLDVSKYAKSPIDEEEEVASIAKQDRPSEKPLTGETELDREGEDEESEDEDRGMSADGTLTSPAKDTNNEEEEEEEVKKVDKKKKKEKGVKMHNAEPSSILYVESDEKINKIFANKKGKMKKKSKKRSKI